LVAIADTIKILNDDDALDLFKKTLPSASAGAAALVQVRGSSVVLRQKALAFIKKAQKSDAKNPDFDFIALAIKGKKIGFEKVFKMIDDMVAHLKTEQIEDDGKLEYCQKQLDQADDKKKGLEQTISDEQTAISDTTEKLATVKDEIKALEAGIKKLDKSVAESSEQRKEEHEEFTELMASDSAAKELLKFAVNRLNKFYNPKLYVPPVKEVTFVQIAEHTHRKDAPAPPPETYGAYEKKSESSTGVVSMINLLIRDLDKEMTEAETSEEDSQKDYEEAMKDAAEKRAQDSKSLTEKEGAKARMETEVQDHKESEAGATKELMATAEYIGNLHTECDWLMKYYDVRKEARASEIDALGQAKAVLSGADFSFAQTKKAFMAKA
jgi:chromosome segregation ATPase